MEEDWAASGDSPESGASNRGLYASVAMILAVASPVPAADAGSGGMMTPEALKARPGWVSTDSTSAEFEVLTDLIAQDVSATLQERLEALKNELGLTITDMAELFGVARPSIYAWLKGQEPRRDNVERLVELESYAEQVGALGLSRVDKLIKRPLRSGPSLFVLIKNGGTTRQALAELASIAEIEEHQRTTAKGRNVMWTAREAADYISTEGIEKDS